MNDPGALIRRLVRPAVLSMQAYHVPPATGMIKLDAMENPYGWPEELLQDWLEQVGSAPLNRYPDPSATLLKARMRRTLQVPDGAELLLGNGSDELIQLLGMALGGDDRCVLTPGPGFAMYRIIAGFTGMDYVEVPLRPGDFGLDRDATLAAIRRHQPAIVYLAYPNNPTGNAFDRDDVEAVIEAAPGVVVLDEAYYAFCGQSFSDELARYPQLLVMRTVSKMGLAGLRLGYLMGHPAWLEQLEKCRLPYNIGVLTQLSASFSLDHVAVFEEQTARICADRQWLFEALAGIEELQVWPSQANFITFRVPTGSAGAIHQSLREERVLIKKLDGSHPMLDDCLRVTVGTPEENAAFLEALERALGTR
ncbi:MAG: histidinol-phosphate transaminase [Ectothiorhodospiraceae bacterium]|nr:histidinol-phosphate transaminase [Ectothiorhodospiraceae bacterium]MCH8503843.1 histidinol-phosphate transaminase [Ectothiorhodospiraceae bacterium]